MEVFNRDNKVNFVDKNNVFVGYDLSQKCCEYATWFVYDSILDTVPDDIKFENSDNLEEFVFDKSFFLDIYALNFPKVNHNDEDGNVIGFRLIKDGKKDKKFLYLINSHNGYYSHGFEMKDNDKILREGEI